jgi:hypothetical protein
MAAESQIRIWRLSNDSVTLDYASVRVHYSPQGERITDRLGLTHRIAPATLRFPTGLTLSVLAEELTGISTAPQPMSVVDWLETRFRQQELLIAYVRGESLCEGGAALTRNLAYACYIEELPSDYFGTLPTVGQGPEAVDLSLLVVGDGTFTDFSLFSSMTLGQRP